MRKPTIYEALRDRLGREPTAAELKGEVKRILEEGLQEQAAKGKLRHQRKRNPRPRVGTKKATRASSATGKRPTARLVARRKANTRKGYFPNPTGGNSKQRRKAARHPVARPVYPFIVAQFDRTKIAGFKTQDAAVHFAKSWAKHYNAKIRVFKE